MIKNNKVINKLLLPKVLLCSIFIASTSCASMYLAHEDIKRNTYVENSDLLLMSIVILFTAIFCMDVYSDYKRNERKMISIAREYLKQEMQNTPDLKLFAKVLDNKQAMQNISALVFNSLRPSERKHISQLVLNMYNKLEDAQKRNQPYESDFYQVGRQLLNNARTEIIKTIREHASIHPEFARNLYSAMASADMIYIMPQNPIQQHTR